MAEQSLSPRPEMLMTMICSRPMEGASFRAQATAWADSMAGIMPSMRLMYAKASTASPSVTLTYSARPVSWSQACSGPMPG